MGKGLGVIAADLNGDGRPDLYVANDTVDNFLYFNRGKGKLEEVALSAGAGRDEHGRSNGSMGLAVGDYDHSGLPSIFVTTYENETHALYHNLGKELFLHSTSAAGIAALGQAYVGFGTTFVDLDHHGWEDLVICNGHVIRHPVHAGLRQAPVLLRNRGKDEKKGPQFKEVTAQGGLYFKGQHIARGLAVGDLDNDGRIDIVISHLNHSVVVLRNVADVQKNHWLGLELAGRKARDLVGSKVVVEANGRQWTQFVKGGGSYLSAHDPRIVVGLGPASRIDRLTVSWSHGQSEQWDGKDLAVDRYWRIREGEKGVTPPFARP
jgi:hypothetical protein